MVQRVSQRVLILLFFLCVASIAWGETPNPSSFSTIELDRPLHFFGVDGTDMVIQPGHYQVEAAESWLKLVPEGESRSAAMLLEANLGRHEETLMEPVVRSEEDKDNSDVFHIAVLLPDGSGLEAIGTKSGIRPRAVNFAFMGRTSLSGCSKCLGITNPLLRHVCEITKCKNTAAISNTLKQTKSPAKPPSRQRVKKGQFKGVMSRGIDQPPAFGTPDPEPPRTTSPIP